MQWGLSSLDWRSHAIDETRHHTIGVRKVECGHLLRTVTQYGRLSAPQRSPVLRRRRAPGQGPAGSAGR